MNERRLELALKKQALVLTCAMQRQQLSEYTAKLRPVFAGADKANDAVRWLRQHPASSVAAGALLAALRPRVVWRWCMRGWSAWRVMKRLRGRG